MTYGSPVTGPHVIPFLPSYIPPGVDMNQVNADVADDGIAVPPAVAADVPALREVVDEAGQQGINLKIVVIEQDPPTDTPLRDIATEVGQAYPGSTVLVLSPAESGSYSPTIDRVTLEAGQDVAEGRGAVQGAKNFLGELTTPHFPWTAFTILLVLAVVAAVIGTRLLQLRSKRTLSGEEP